MKVTLETSYGQQRQKSTTGPSLAALYIPLNTVAPLS